MVDLRTGRLPPGQIVTERFPVVGEREPAPSALDLDRWRLRVVGLVGRPLELTLPEVLDLGVDQVAADIHCVTSWTRFGLRFEGVPLGRLLDAAGVAPRARFVRFEAHSTRAHDTSLPLDVASVGSWLVHRIDGEPLTVEHGWPLRVVTPARYFYKSIKWLSTVELLAEDRLGYWERESHYHNVGDPWPGDQRFTTGSLRPAQAEAFRNAPDLAKYRLRVLLGLDLAGWEPLTGDLRDLRLKGCDLRGANLAGRDLRRINLSLSDLSGADLRDADLRDADVEGADFSGADLSGADLRGAFASAARFEGARVGGLRWDGVSGLVESQEAYLRRAAAGGAGPAVDGA